MYGVGGFVHRGYKCQDVRGAAGGHQGGRGKGEVETAASKTTEAKAGDAVAPTAPKQPVDDPVVPAKDVEVSAGAAKRPSGGMSALSAKHERRRKPESLGISDG